MYPSLSVQMPHIDFKWNEIYNSNLVITIYRMLMPSDYLEKITTLSASEFKKHLRVIHRTIVMTDDELSATYVAALLEISERKN